MMYKVPNKFIARIVPDEGKPGVDDYESYLLLVDVLDAVEEYGREDRSVGSVLTVWFDGSYWIATYYEMPNKHDAAFDAARNGFPFFTDDNNIPMKVGLLARLHRAII
jgi:hypothetical protein